MKDSRSSVYINPLTDFGFKYIFGPDADKEFLLSFLNALIKPDEPITEVEFIDKEHKGQHKDDRALIYDLHCTLADKSKIIVEMQNRYQPNFDDRALYYLAADIHSQGHKGDEWQFHLTPVYGIFIMNFEWRNVEEQHLREDVCLMNLQTKRIFSDKMRMTYLKLPMLDKDEEECKDTLDRWLFILKNMDRMEAMPTTFMKDPVFRRLGKVSRVAALSEQQLREYEASLKVYRDNLAIMQNERAEGRAEGLAEGLAKGRVEGLEEGLHKGRAEGRAEGELKARDKSIRLMSSLNISPEWIAREYGMTIEEVLGVINE